MNDEIMFLVDGNPGALSFIIEASRLPPQMQDYAATAFSRMHYAGIKGSQLYMIWNDCCHRNTNTAIKVLLERSIDEIKEHISGPSGIEFEEVTA